MSIKDEKGFVQLLAAIAGIICAIIAILGFFEPRPQPKPEPPCSTCPTPEPPKPKPEPSSKKQDTSESEQVGVDTEETVAAKAINFATLIETKSKLIQSLGDAEFEKQMKANSLKKILSALEHIGEYENELKGLVSGNPKIQLALDFLKRKEYFQQEYDKISDKYK